NSLTRRRQMQYHDPLYGSWQLPELIQRLLCTDRFKRMDGISLSILPDTLRPDGRRMATRLEHCLGAARVASEVTRHNDLDERLKALIVLSASMHDIGNPPFAHL